MGGRITRKDVLAYIEREEAQGQGAPAGAAPVQSAQAPQETIQPSGTSPFQGLQIRRLRNRRLHLAQLFRMCVIPGAFDGIAENSNHRSGRNGRRQIGILYRCYADA